MRTHLPAAPGPGGPLPGEEGRGNRRNVCVFPPEARGQERQPRGRKEAGRLRVPLSPVFCPLSVQILARGSRRRRIQRRQRTHGRQRPADRLSRHGGGLQAAGRHLPLGFTSCRKCCVNNHVAAPKGRIQAGGHQGAVPSPSQPVLGLQGAGSCAVPREGVRKCRRGLHTQLG